MRWIIGGVRLARSIVAEPISLTAGLLAWASILLSRAARIVRGEP